MIYEFNGYKPVIDPSSFIHKEATIIGNVIIGKNVYIGPGASLRGDWGQITIKDGCNVQDNCIIHIFPGKDVVLQENAHIGHGAIIHGANIGKNTLVGMNAVVMDDARIGDECIIGALCFIKGETHVPNRKIIVGNPGKKIGEIDEKGNRKYFTLGAGLKMNVFTIDFAYLVPANQGVKSLLENTMRFSLIFDIGAFSSIFGSESTS